MEMLPPRIIRKPLTRSELVSVAPEQFGDMVKAVVDVERGIMAISPRGHADLAAGRWKSLTLIEQLANVGSEVDRAINAHEAGRSGRRDAAVNRCLELFDLTAADDRWRGARRREVLRAREEFCALFWGDGERPGAAAALSKYFLHFALAARRAAGRA